MRVLALFLCTVPIVSAPQARTAQGSRVALQRDPRAHPGPATVDVSGDGQLIAFESAARLSPIDTNSFGDVYVLDRSSGRITLESVAADGGGANGSSAWPRLNQDGRFLVFTSVSTTLGGPSPELMLPQVFRRDRWTGKTQMLSHASDGTPANGGSGSPSISDDGRIVAFESAATNLTEGRDANGTALDVYVWDAERDAVERLSVTTGGLQSADGWSGTPSVSGAGRHVAFVSSAALDGPDPVTRGASGPSRNRLRHVFLRDVWNRTTRLVSRTSDGVAIDGYSPDISRDGRLIAFVSTSSRAGETGRNGESNVYLHHTGTGRLVLVSRSAAGGTADGRSNHPALSGDGRYVAFASDASNMTCVHRCAEEMDLNLVSDIFRFDIVTGIMIRISGAGPPSDPWWESSAGLAIDASGGVIAFSSYHPVDPADVDHDLDVFIEVLPREAGSR